MAKRRNVIFALVLFAILISTFFGERGLIRAWHLRREAETIRVKIDDLKAENEKLKMEREALQKKDRRYIEKLARQQLGLTMPKEKVYLFPAHQKPEETVANQAPPPTKGK